MKLFRRLIPLIEAQKEVLRHVKCTGVEEVSFELASGRVLAEDIASEVDIPPFDRAAMDGYAVKAEDTFGAAPNKPRVLKRAGTGTGAGGLRTGEYVPIQTGMPMPEGSNAVIMLEYAGERVREREGKGDSDDDSRHELEVFKPVTPGKNVSLRGEDVRSGEIVLNSGRLLRPTDLGMLAAIGRRRVKVHKRAVVGIISTGDELYDPKTGDVNGSESGEGAIADVNSYMLGALVSSIAEPSRVGIVRDDYNDIKAAISSCIEYSDVILVSGGSSVGKRDFTGDVVEDLGRMIFHGVAIRPGEPTGFGIINDKPVFCLPGYPVALLAAFELLVMPCLRAMHGLKVGVVVEGEGEGPISGAVTGAVASKKIPSAVGRTDFVRVRLCYNPNRNGKSAPRYFVEPIRVSGSGILSSVTKSDGFVIVEENREGIEEGEEVVVRLW